MKSGMRFGTWTRKALFSVTLCVAAMSTLSEDSNSALSAFHAAIVGMSQNREMALPREITQSNNPHVKPYGAILASDKWDKTQIAVCWENPSPGSTLAMQWTRDAISKTWESVSPIRFTGWLKCAAVNKGVRIQIADTGPYVKMLGHYLDGKVNGMVLNFSFKHWSTSCQDTMEYCVRAIAVHEFGHALGFTHEQNRADTPGECTQLAQGTNPDKTLTPYDPDSVMNYCNKKWNNNGYLSALDIQAVQLLYPKAS